LSEDVCGFTKMRPPLGFECCGTCPDDSSSRRMNLSELASEMKAQTKLFQQLLALERGAHLGALQTELDRDPKAALTIVNRWDKDRGRGAHDLLEAVRSWKPATTAEKRTLSDLDSAMREARGRRPPVLQKLDTAVRRRRP